MQDCCVEGCWIMATPNCQSLANTQSTRTNWRIHTRIRLIVFCWLRRWLRESHWSPTTANLLATQVRYAKCKESSIEHRQFVQSRSCASEFERSASPRASRRQLLPRALVTLLQYAAGGS